MAESADEGALRRSPGSKPSARTSGDVRLRYQSSLLTGEAARPSPGALLPASLIIGAASGMATLGGLIAGASNPTVGGSLLLSAVAFWVAVQLDRRAHRQRRFVLNFSTASLRLDFSTPFANHPRTLIIHFDGVRDCVLCAQGEGLMAITVDFVAGPLSQQLLREVLVASIPPSEQEAAARLHRMLKGAFGLGSLKNASGPVQEEPSPKLP